MKAKTMRTFLSLTARDTKLFFKDRGSFFSSLITPVILLVLYATFLLRIYQNSFKSGIPPQAKVPESTITALSSSQMISSLLAVSCITITFTSSLLIVKDRASHRINDLTVTPIRMLTLSAAYFASSFLASMIVNGLALIASLIYLHASSVPITASMVAWILVDVVVLTLFGTAMATALTIWLNTTAVGSIVNAGYGFICGAYMPFASYSPGLQKVCSYLPSTYATTVIRQHVMGSSIDLLKKAGLPTSALDSIKEGISFTVSFQGNPVPTDVMYGVLVGFSLVFLLIFILGTRLRGAAQR
ncbi:ABC transporter permease [Parascardovia denticolens IPLA 20019]|uniref:ABC transporter permease n=1 Tax=Parascardovia denticolens TaxID=78258 RepID=UPI000266BAF9|nr:ABC transporter permease [Parascardovia denticolens]EIT88458.1 ABC transporter permease [Parascardovia denticolens IPLA 20019]